MKMKICILADAASIHTQRWVRAFAERGHEIHLVSFQPCGEPIPQMACYSLLSLTPGRLLFRKLPGARTVEFWLRAVYEMRNLLDRIRPQLVHAHYVSGYGYLAALSGWRPVILTAWGSDIYLHPSRSLLNRGLTRLALNRADLITADSQDLLQEIARLGESSQKLHLVQFGVDLQIFFPQAEKDALRTEWGIRPEEVVIFSPRSLASHYNIETVVRSFASLKRNFPKASLFLKDTTRTDSYRAQIQALIGDLGITNCVRWVDFIPDAEMAEIYNLADVVISIAKTDGTPVSVLEALSCGAVVVAGDLPSLQEWITDGVNGFLARPDHLEEVKEKLGQALRLDKKLRQEWARMNRSMMRAKGDREEAIDQMENLYQGLIQAKRG